MVEWANPEYFWMRKKELKIKVLKGFFKKLLIVTKKRAFIKLLFYSVTNFKIFPINAL